MITTGNTGDHLIRSELWSSQLKEILEDELLGMNFVDMIGEFSDGTTINIPSIGQAEVTDYAEDEPITYSGLDTGNFEFSIDKYKSSATYITRKMLQDSIYAPRVLASFVPKQARALMVSMENDMFTKMNAGQTQNTTNLINTARHRLVGTGTSNVMTIRDFMLAAHALDKANVPQAGRVAIVDPTVEMAFNTQSNVLSLITPNMAWGSLVESKMGAGPRFRFNIAGFDVYMSNHLPKGSFNDGTTTVTNGVTNFFFSTATECMIGHVRQAPIVDSEFNKDRQREEYITTARWGFKLYRPENLVTVITDTNQVYS